MQLNVSSSMVFNSVGDIPAARWPQDNAGSAEEESSTFVFLFILARFLVSICVFLHY